MSQQELGNAGSLEAWFRHDHMTWSHITRPSAVTGFVVPCHSIVVEPYGSTSAGRPKKKAEAPPPTLQRTVSAPYKLKSVAQYYKSNQALPLFRYPAHLPLPGRCQEFASILWVLTLSSQKVKVASSVMFKQSLHSIPSALMRLRQQLS